jgi:prepilin-type N-terminal cleavage/methylation domain-containing protein
MWIPVPVRRRSSGAGFTLIELLVVMGVIAVAAAVSLPAIARYIRNYQVRAATQQVSGEIQAARNQAIVKNVNLGVVFVTRSDRTYQWMVEDDQTGTGDTNRTRARTPANATTLGNVTTGAGRDTGQSSPVYTLPANIRFTTTCPAPALTGGGTWKAAMRFNRLGAWCDPTGSGACPTDTIDASAVAHFIYNSSTGSTVCVEENRASNPQRRRVDVLTGGRVAAQR